MCYPVTCKACGKTTWAGCGQHVADVQRGVPAAKWCNGKHTPAQIAEAKASRRGLLSRLFVR
jgi:hypothetical protein